MSKELIEQLANKPVDAEYFCKKLNLVIRDIRSYTAEELSLELTRLANTAYQAAAPIDNVAEALKERDRLGYAVVEVIGKLDEIIEQVEEITLHDLNYFAVPAELWHELEDALEEMPIRAEQVRALIPTQANRTEG
jgi:hypothetical protein